VTVESLVAGVVAGEVVDAGVPVEYSVCDGASSAVDELLVLVEL